MKDAVRLAAEAIARGALQKPWEFASLLNMVKDLNPDAILEIGSDAGGTLYAWGQLAEKVYSIDLPQGPFHTTEGPLNAYGAECRAGDSHDHASMQWAFARSPFDMVFIDGDHTYEGCWQDFRDYAPFVRPGGLVVLHDICYHGETSACGVDRVWQEASKGYERKVELIQTPTHWGGIGVMMR